MAFARAITTMGLSQVMSFLGIYVVETRGYPAWSYGLIALIANLGQSLSNAWAGSLSDRIGRRPLITTSLFARSVVVALIGVQILLDAPLWTLAVNMIANATLRGCFEPVAYALVGDVARDDQRVSAFGIQRMGTNLGWAVGPALGGVLTLVIPYGAVFLIAGAATALAGVVTLRITDPARPRPAASRTTSDTALRATLRSGMRHPALRLLLLGTFLCALLETQMFSTLSIYATTRLALTKADVGLVYSINGIGVLVLQMPVLALIRRLGIGRVLPWASLIDALGFALIGLASGFTGIALAMFTLTCAEVLFDPAQQTAIAEMADPANRGRTFGVVGFASMLGIALAPLVGGVLFDTIGTHRVAMWLAIAAFGIGQTACFAAFVRQRARLPPLSTPP